jgi:hypothetical protein
MARKSHRKIHKKLREHFPDSVERAEDIFAFKYPKLFWLFSLIVAAYFIFSRPFASEWIEQFNNLGHVGAFISGALTSLGFTTPFGIGLLINLKFQNILLAVLIAGIGATVADLLIFKVIKNSFMDEFKQLEKTKVIREIDGIVKKNKSVLIRHYLLYIFAGIVLATPLPDELGVSMLAGLTTINPLKLAIIGFVLHTSFIFCLVYFI